jgi:hypothetical protein
VDAFKLADALVADQFTGEAEIIVGALLAAGLEDALVPPHGVHHGSRFADGVGEGFFAVNILARSCRFDGNDGVPVLGHGDEDGVDVFALKQLAEVQIGCAAGIGAFVKDIGIGLFNLFFRAISHLFAHVAHGQQLHLAIVHEAVEMPGAHVADADEADIDALRGRGRFGGADGRGGDDVGSAIVIDAAVFAVFGAAPRRRQRGRRGLQKSPP